ncbi:hypothetical protein, partial [Geotalea toluenoxydans]|uniref:hypothetical protein n=1 Tax=Geotalea toluenoxydans TaxID=421624 RepID=UPI001FB40A38
LLGPPETGKQADKRQPAPSSSLPDTPCILPSSSPSPNAGTITFNAGCSRWLMRPPDPPLTCLKENSLTNSNYFQVFRITDEKRKYTYTCLSQQYVGTFHKSSNRGGRNGQKRVSLRWSGQQSYRKIISLHVGKEKLSVNRSGGQK